MARRKGRGKDGGFSSVRRAMARASEPAAGSKQGKGIVGAFVRRVLDRKGQK